MLRINPCQVQFASQVHGGMLQRLHHRQVSVVTFHIFTNQGDLNRGFMVLSDNSLPSLPKLSTFGYTGEGNRYNTKIQPGSEQRDELLLLQQKWDLVDCGHISNHKNLINLNRTM